MSKKYNTQLIFNLDEGTARWLADYAEEHGGTMGGVVRHALEEGLEEERDVDRVDTRVLVRAHVSYETREAVLEIAKRAECSIASACRHLVEAGVRRKKDRR
jgi:hypothetical protein